MNQEQWTAITQEQRNTLAEKFASQSHFDSMEEMIKASFLEICGPAVMVPWCGMWCGIEKDGYSHT